MCIRDRLQTQTAPHIVESVQKLKDYLSLVYLLRGRICLYAVSYTHLRAHETVLDLVCRLLLEKKKNSSHTSHY